MLVITIFASQRSSIAKHLVKNSTCANSFNLTRLKIVKTISIFDLIKLKAIYIF